MRQRLLSIGFVITLLLGGWTSALAATCIHAGVGVMSGEEISDCCLKDSTSEVVSCPMRTGEFQANHDGEVSAAREGGTTYQRHGAAIVAVAPANQAGVAGLLAESCAFCTPHSGHLPASYATRAPNVLKRDDGTRDERAPAQLYHSTKISFVRAVAPRRVESSRNVSCHVLHSVFLI